MTNKRTVMQSLDAMVERASEQPAIRYKQGARWWSKTWSEYREEIHTAAKAMIWLGVEPTKAVSILGFNCPQWAISHFAAIHCGARPVGVYTTSSTSQCEYIVSHSETQLLVVENREQLEKVRAIKTRLSDIRAIVMMFEDDDDPEVLSWVEFMSRGREVDDAELHRRMASQRPDDVCSYLYTSGTTGRPKGVMLSHDNITFQSKQVWTSVNVPPENVSLSYLPLAHIGEQIMSLYGQIFNGSEVAFAQSMDKLPENLCEVRPTLFLGVPRVWEKMGVKVLDALEKASGVKRRLGDWATTMGRRAGLAQQNGDPQPLLFPLADKLVLAKVRERLGLDRCRVAFTAAAPIARETLEFFLGLGVPIYEVYGMTELTGAGTISYPGVWRLGKAGRPILDTEVKTGERGELMIRGRHTFKGYLKDPEVTNATIDPDGWVHTGDIGTIDDDGYVEITGRLKELIVTAGGKNVSPAPLENDIRAIFGVSQVVVVGDKRPFVGALVTLDPEQIGSLAERAGASTKRYEDAVKDPRVLDWVMAQVDKINAHYSRAESVRKIVILPAPLTIEDDELTSTMKIRRKNVLDKYKGTIDALYA